MVAYIVSPYLFESSLLFKCLHPTIFSSALLITKNVSLGTYQGLNISYIIYNSIYQYDFIKLDKIQAQLFLEAYKRKHYGLCLGYTQHRRDILDHAFALSSGSVGIKSIIVRY